MDFLLDALTNWLKEMLVGGIMGNLSGMFDSVNQQVGDIATQVGQTPQGWNGSIFSMIPVSYTHLDVYKRQSTSSPSPKRRIRPSRIRLHQIRKTRIWIARIRKSPQN